MTESAIINHVSDDLSENIRVVDEFAGDLVDGACFVGSEFDERFTRIFFELLDELDSFVTQSHSTRRTEPGHRLGKSHATLRAGFEGHAVRIGGFDETEIRKFLLTRLLAFDVVVPSHHSRSLLPASAMLNAPFALALTSPVGDTTVPEVVGFEPRGIDIGSPGDSLEDVPDVAVGESLAFDVAPVNEDMEERRVVVLGVGVGVEPRDEVSARPRDRERTLGTLCANGFIVDLNLSSLPDEFDILDSQGSERANSETCVGEEGEHRTVARVGAGVEEVVDLVGVEEFVGVDVAVDGRTNLNLVVPLDILLLVETLESLPVVSESAFSKRFVLVGTGSLAEVEEKYIDIVLVSIDERYVALFETAHDAGEVVDNGRLLDLTHSTRDETFDCASVTLVDVHLGKLLSLFLEDSVEVVNIVHIGHRYSLRLRINRHSAANPGGTIFTRKIQTVAPTGNLGFVITD